MKILQVTPRYSPQTGGVERHVREISTRLTADGHDVTVLSADASGIRNTTEKRDEVTIIRHRNLAPGNAYHVAPDILLTVRRLSNDVDVVHAHNYHSLPMGFASLGLRRHSCPLILTPHYHGASASPVRDTLLRAYNPFGGRMLRNAAAVIAVSEWEATQIERDFGVKPTVIPNGVDLDRFEGAVPATTDRPYILTVGRLEPYKHVDDIVRALTALPGYDLHIAGTGPAQDDIEKTAETIGVRDRVNFLGYVPDEQLPRLYAGADAYITLSEFEAYGMTVAEALATGTPCVVRNDGVLQEWTRFDGVRGIPVTTPDIVADAVRNVIGMSVSATLPSWDDVTAKIISIYESEISS